MTNIKHDHSDARFSRDAIAHSLRRMEFSLGKVRSLQKERLTLKFKHNKDIKGSRKNGDHSSWNTICYFSNWNIWIISQKSPFHEEQRMRDRFPSTTEHDLLEPRISSHSKYSSARFKFPLSSAIALLIEAITLEIPSSPSLIHSQTHTYHVANKNYNNNIYV